MIIMVRMVVGLVMVMIVMVGRLMVMMVVGVVMVR